MERFGKSTVTILCLATLMLLYSIYWYAFAKSLKEGITVFLLDQTQKGVSFSFEEIKVVGYPASFKIIVSDPSLVAKLPSQWHSDIGWYWEGVRAIAQIKPWNLSKVRVNLFGDHKIKFKMDRLIYRSIFSVLKSEINYA